jgi:hypothetical protein
MRLNKTDQAKATDELLSLLAQHPEGMTTKELMGTPKFHGEKTLRSRQIIRLLRQSGKVAESYTARRSRNQKWEALRFWIGYEGSARTLYPERSEAP